MHRLGEQSVDAPAFNFPGHESHADKHRHQDTGQFKGGQPDVLDDLHVLPGGNLPDEDRRRDQDQREPRDREQDAIAHAFLEDVPGHQPYARHDTCSTNTSSSVARVGDAETSAPPNSVSAAMNGSGRSPSANSKV